MEIERKYLLDRLPEGIENYECKEIEQGYLCMSPTLRIRKMGDMHVLCIKEHVAAQGEAVHSREEEFVMSQQAYEHLRAKCDGWISKHRYRVDLRSMMCDGLYAGLVAEVDVFHGCHEGLLMVEVEFPNTDAANAFVPPEWFGKEVSSDLRYRNSSLAQCHEWRNDKYRNPSTPRDIR